MKLTIIGFWGGYPAANEASTGYLLQKGGFSLLIDCGSAVLSQLQNYLKPEELDAVILSHYHHDHIADVGPLQFARLIGYHLNNQQAQLPIYAHQKDTEGFKKLSYKDITIGKAYNPNQPIMIGPFKISFLKTKHPVACYAMRITDGEKVIVYTADTSYITELIDFAKDANLLLSECNFYANQDGSNAGHMTSIDAGTLADAANVDELILTHLPHFGNVSDLVTEASTIFKGKIQLAKTGLVWEHQEEKI